MAVTALALSTAQKAMTVCGVLSAKITTRSPRCDAAAHQRVGQRVGLGLDLGVGEALAVTDQRDLAGQPRGRLVEVVVELRHGCGPPLDMLERTHAGPSRRRSATV